MRNIRLTLAYDGTDFHGWQRQPDLATVQECIENAIGHITGSKSTVCGSGRTDAGVHAAGQVAHFKTDCSIPSANLVKALNDQLPPGVRVKDAADAAANFHARYQAKSKVYRYRILQSPLCPPFLWRFVCHYPYALDHSAMVKAANLLEGRHDFTSFAAAGEERSEARSQKQEARMAPGEPRGAVRKIFSSRIIARPSMRMLIYDVRGSGFLHHMVRNIVGTLMEVGRGKIAPEEILRILKARDRTMAGPTAPARGLCLMRVDY